MKIFILPKKSLCIMSLALLLTAALILLSPEKNGLFAAASQKELPIYAVNSEEKKVAITFNCAWGDEDMDDVLKTLDAFGAKCTFFLVGTWAEKYPDAVAKIKKAGHEIGGHGYDHTSYKKMTAAEMETDLEKTEAAILGATGEGIRLFRAPSGDYSEAAVKTVRLLGKEIIQWDVDSLDYKNLTAEEMRERILPRLRPGSIVLFHTGTKVTAQSLPYLLEAIQGEGYGFETVGNLLLPPPFQINHQGVQYKAEEGQKTENKKI